MADQSNEMVERVARALADQSPRCRGWWSDMSDLERTAWRNSARAAIEAMREMSDEAAEAAAIRLYEYETGGTAESWHGASVVIKSSSRIRAWAAYTAALDATLSHDEVKG